MIFNRGSNVLAFWILDIMLRMINEFRPFVQPELNYVSKGFI